MKTTNMAIAALAALVLSLAGCATAGNAGAAASPAADGATPKAADSGAPKDASAAPAGPATAAPKAANAPSDSGNILAAKGSAFGTLPGASTSAQSLSSFARESLPTFATFKLSNGIPVVVKKNPANRVQHISLVIKGGALAATTATAGHEALALRTMARGSAKYSYEDIQALLDETSSSMGPETTFEYSAYNLTTLDKYFARLLPVWADTLIRPGFAKDDFDQVLSQAKLAIQGKEQNPWTKTGLVINDEFFKGHPYAASPDGTRDSLAAATLEATKAWYAAAFSSNRMFVVAVGDFDPAALKVELEAGLSPIPDRGFALPPPAPAFEVPALGTAGRGSLVKFEFPPSKGIGYVRGDFAAPGPEDPAFMPLSLGMKMLSDLLFDVVRDKYGATYSPSAYIRAFGANYGSLTIFKTKVAGKVKAYIDEAVADIAAGRVMSVDPTSSGGANPRMTLAEALPVYKARFVNELYDKQQTNAAVASRIAQSVVYSGDYRTWLLDIDRISAVTPESVQDAVAKYLLGGKISWVALGSQDVLLPVLEVDFESLGRK